MNEVANSKLFHPRALGHRKWNITKSFGDALFARPIGSYMKETGNSIVCRQPSCNVNIHVTWNNVLWVSVTDLNSWSFNFAKPPIEKSSSPGVCSFAFQSNELCAQSGKWKIDQLRFLHAQLPGDPFRSDAFLIDSTRAQMWELVKRPGAYLFL